MTPKVQEVSPWRSTVFDLDPCRRRQVGGPKEFLKNHHLGVIIAEAFVSKRRRAYRKAPKKNDYLGGKNMSRLVVSTMYVGLLLAFLFVGCGNESSEKSTSSTETEFLDSDSDSRPIGTDPDDSDIEIVDEPEQSFIRGSLSRQWNFFGYDVAMSADGSRLAVAAPHVMWGSTSDDLDGRVYVFSRKEGAWHEEALLRASGLEAPAQAFGRSIALSADGNTLAVGAYDWQALYVFIRTEDTWTQSFFTRKEVGNFGGAVTLSADGNWLAVGAREGGLAVVYKRSGSSWAEHAELKPKDPRLNSFGENYFGRSIALSGEGRTLAVGASPKTEVLGSGAVYVFVREQEEWTEQATLEASSPVKYAGMGSALSLSADGNTLVAGASEKNDMGIVYVFERKESVWSEQGVLDSPNAEHAEDFGESVSVSSDGRLLAVGDPYEGEHEIGGVYLYVLNQNTWTMQKHITATPTEWSSEFGVAVALSGDGSALAVGSSGIGSEEGGVYVFAPIVDKE